MIGVDILHVLDLGVTRMLVHQLVRVYPHVCAAAGHNPASGSTKAACLIVNIRVEHMGRRSKATAVAPGCASSSVSDLSSSVHLWLPGLFSFHILCGARWGRVSDAFVL